MFIWNKKCDDHYMSASQSLLGLSFRATCISLPLMVLFSLSLVLFSHFPFFSSHISLQSLLYLSLLSLSLISLLSLSPSHLLLPVHLFEPYPFILFSPIPLCWVPYFPSSQCSWIVEAWLLEKHISNIFQTP